MQKILIVISVLVLFLGSQVLAGTAGPSTTTAPSTLPTTNPAESGQPIIPYGDLAFQAETLSITLRQIKSEVSADHSIQAITEELPILSQEIDSRLVETTSLLQSSPSLEELPRLENDWKAISTKVKDWKSLLAKRLEEVGGENQYLSNTLADWQQTQQVALAHHVSTELLDHISGAISKIEKAQSQLLVYKTQHLWPLSRNLDDQDARVLDVLSSVQEARTEAFGRLFIKDSPPIWSVLTHWPADQHVVREGTGSFATQLSGLQAYIIREREVFAAAALVFCVFAAVLYWARRRVKRAIEKDPSLATATIAFESPLLTSIVLCLLSSTWIYPQPPRMLGAIIGAAALIPTVLILRRLIERRLFAILDGMVVFYFLDQLREVVASQQIISRLLFLAEMLAGILFLISFLARTSSRKTVAEPADHLWKLVQAGTRMVLVVFVVAFVASALGYVSFANLIGDATLNSGYLAVILYAVTQIADGLLVIALRSRPLALLAIVRRHEAMLQVRLSRLVVWIAFALWAAATLEMLSVRSVVLEFITRALDVHLGVGSLHLSLRNLLTFVITVWASFFLSRVLRFVLEEDVYSRFALSSGITYAVSKMLHYAILLTGFFVAVAALGYNLTNFTILAGAFGVGLGFGMQNVINNFVSGLILLFERPIKVGDVIQLDDACGTVQHIGIRASILRTTDSSEIIVPNGSILSSRVTNWTRSNSQRGIEIPVGVAGTADPKRVIEVLISVAAAHPLVTDDPRPQAFLEKFNGDGYSFKLRAWTDRADGWAEISSDLAVAIHEAFSHENITLK